MRSAARPTVTLTPAMVFCLMTGQSPAVRLPGWVTLALGESAAAAWRGHQSTILAAAHAHGFEPYWATNRTPTGPGFRRWRDAFLAEHTY